MNRLIAETTGQRSYNGVWFGLSLFQIAEGRFQAVLHTRTYDGIRVQDKWDSQPILLNATDKDAAWTEAFGHRMDLIKAVQG
jgi:hypothetical protein